MTSFKHFKLYSVFSVTILIIVNYKNSVEPSKRKSQNQTSPAKIDINIFHSSASADSKCYRSALTAKVESVIPTEASFSLLPSSASISNYSLPYKSDTGDLMTGD
jgi:hypothetical protein